MAKTKQDGNKIEIYYFHFTKRCATCNAVENETKSVLESKYADKLKKGEISFTSLNLDEKADKKVAEKLELVGMRGVQKLKPAELSGGMKKRVGLARALITDPDYIIYDEPTTGLDPIMSDSIDGLIKDLTDKLNATS